MKKKTLFATLVLSLLIITSFSFYVSAIDDGAAKETELNGTAASDSFGQSVSSGDVNNDGYDDIIVGAYLSDSPEQTDAGQAFVFFGTANGITDMDAMYANITLNGTIAGDYFGSYTAIGDVNNDSYDDVIVGAYGANPGGSNSGQAYVFFGADYTSAVNQDALSYANITINGTVANEYLGPVASGDINNDNYTDIIAGSLLYGGTDLSGQVFVFFGAEYAEDASYSFSSLSSANITLNGTVLFDFFGYSVASGDINNDDYSDVIVGASTADPQGVSGAGQAYVFFGADYTSAINEAASAYANITLNGTVAGDQFGISVGSGDVNNDNYADVIVGATTADPSGQTDAGQAFVFFGANYTSAINEDASAYANITLNGTVAGDNLGYSVASGDVNNDNYAEIIAGAYLADPANETSSNMSDAGQAFVFFGASYTTTINQDASSYANITLNGTAASDDFGRSVASGDINKDNYADVIVGAYLANPSGVTDAGQAYTYAYDNVNPVVSLDLTDNSYDTDGDINFSFTTVENHPEYCTLYFRSNVTNWAANDSVVYLNNTQTNVYLNLTDAVYVWNVECNDSALNPATFASANRTLTVDTTVPTTPTVTEPSDTSINPRGSISYTCETSDVTAGISKWAWTLIKPDSTIVTKTGGEVTSNSQSFSGDDDNLAGTYTVSCEAEDKAGWKKSSSSTFTVYFSHATGEGAGAGPSAAAQLDLSTEEEITITEKQGTISTFTLDGITVHIIKIKEVTETTVTLVIESDPITITLTIGETEEVDVDGDGINDISVTLNSITDGVADITTKRLTPLPAKEKLTEEIQPTEKPEEEITPPEEVASKAWLWMLIIVILAVIGVGYWYTQKKKQS